jgi:hypothetical protein
VRRVEDPHLGEPEPLGEELALQLGADRVASTACSVRVLDAWSFRRRISALADERRGLLRFRRARSTS